MLTIEPVEEENDGQGLGRLPERRDESDQEEGVEGEEAAADTVSTAAPKARRTRNRQKKVKGRITVKVGRRIFRADSFDERNGVLMLQAADKRIYVSLSANPIVEVKGPQGHPDEVGTEAWQRGMAARLGPPGPQTSGGMKAFRERQARIGQRRQLEEAMDSPGFTEGPMREVAGIPEIVRNG